MKFFYKYVLIIINIIITLQISVIETDFLYSSIVFWFSQVKWYWPVWSFSASYVLYALKIRIGSMEHVFQIVAIKKITTKPFEEKVFDWHCYSWSILLINAIFFLWKYAYKNSRKILNRHSLCITMSLFSKCLDSNK